MSENKIISVALSQIPLATASNYCQKLKTILGNYATVTTAVDVTLFYELVAELKSAMVSQQLVNQTERLAELDAKRDCILSAFNLKLKAQTLMPDENQQDAKDLYAIMHSFGVSKVREASYGDETAYIKSIVERCNTSPNVEKMGRFPDISDCLTMLDDTNSEFLTVMDEKADDMNLKGESATAIRRKLVPVYIEMVEMIEAHAKVGTAPEFKQLITEINNQIATYHLG